MKICLQRKEYTKTIKKSWRKSGKSRFMLKSRLEPNSHILTGRCTLGSKQQENATREGAGWRHTLVTQSRPDQTGVHKASESKCAEREQREHLELGYCESRAEEGGGGDKEVQGKEPDPTGS